MNILVIGNGFDLAHGLKTGYKDFIKFCNIITTLDITDFEQDGFTEWPFFGKFNDHIEENNNCIEANVITFFKNNTINSCLDYIDKCRCNYWLKYINKQNESDDKWCYFEEKITKHLEALAWIEGHVDILFEETKSCALLPNGDEVECVRRIILEEEKKSRKSYNYFELLEIYRKNLLNELNDLILLLNIYLRCFLDKPKGDKGLTDFFNTLRINHVVSFNYTSTYHDVYESFEFNVNFSSANLTQAKLIGANMREVNLSNANLTKVDISDADISGAYMEFKGEQITLNKMPEGFFLQNDILYNCHTKGLPPAVYDKFKTKNKG